MENLQVLVLLIGVVYGTGAAGYGGTSTTFEHCSNNTDIVIVIDSSASITLDDWAKIKVFTIKLIEQLSGEGVFVGINLYSTCAKVIRDVQPIINHQELKTTILKMKHLQGLTNTHLGLQLCQKMFLDSNKEHPKRVGVAKYAIVFSDGMSNRDCMLTLPTAESLKSHPCSVISVAVGDAVKPGTDGYNEMVAISSTQSVITVHDYDSLSDDTIKTICKEFKITEGNPCPNGVKDVKVQCGVFRCDSSHGDYHWRKLYTGCPYKGKCLKWDEEVENPGDCNKYKCSRIHCGESDNECTGFAVPAYKIGCEYGYDCVMEGKERRNPDSCNTETCTKLNGEKGPYGKMVITKRRCKREGQCYDYGHIYEKGCDSYRCSQAGYYAPCKRACQYNDQCLDEDETVEDDCDIKKCVFSEKNELLEMMTVKRRCKDEEQCYDVGAKWTKISRKCVQFCCVEKNGEAVIESEIIGCQKGGDRSCTPVGETVNKVKDSCVEYKCTNEGKFELVKAGCKDEEGNCRKDKENWRPKTGCWINICHVDTRVPTEVKTNIEKLPDCIIKGRCVLRGQTLKLGCLTFRCSPIGHVEILSQECDYKGKCIPVGTKPFVDKAVCKTISCQAPIGGNGAPLIVDEEYGCFQYGVCYDPDAKRRDKGSCIIRQCDGDKHRFFPIVCMVGKKCIKPEEPHIDHRDCVCQVCQINTYPPGAELITKWTGCYYKGKCYKPGATRGSCTVKKCQGNDIWVTVKAACLTRDGQCKEIGTNWFDGQACRQFRCVSNDGGETATVVSVLLGCNVNHDCVKSGVWIGESTCTKYQCQNGTVKQLHVACDLPKGYGYPQCLDIGQQHLDRNRCVIYTCKKVRQNLKGIQVNLIEVPGCKDDRCYFIGQYKNMLCKTFVCRKPSKGLELYKINGCIDENGQCKAIGATWENEDKCVLRTCRRDGTITEKPLGCVDSNDNDICVRFDKTLNNNGAMCQVHICKLVRRVPARYIKYTGCEYRDQCIAFYKTVINKESCKIFTCVKKKGKPALIEKMYGCFSDIDGNCYKYGYVETEQDNKCVQYRCLRGKNAFVVSKAECLGEDGKCYRQNRVWYVKGECTKFKCRRESMEDSYRSRMVNDETEGCEGITGKCLEVGDVVKSKNCTEYVCDPDQGGLVVKKLRCLTDEGSCKEIGDKWIGSKNCADFECLKVSQSRVRIQMKERGCKDDGKRQCYDDGKEVRKKCNIFKCNGDTNQMLPIKIGCWAKKKCFDINATWIDSRCVTSTCILVKKGPNFVITDVEEKQGCKYKKKCYKEGDTRMEGCNQMTCGSDGSWILTVFKCKAENGSCFAAGETYKSKACITYGCDPDAQSVYPVEYECLINKKCVAIGETWFNEKACKYYKCSFEQDKNEAFREEVKIGCKRRGTCIGHGEVKDKDCIKTKCENGQMVIMEAGCEWENVCKKINEEWFIGCKHHKCVIRRQTPTSVSTGIVVIHGCKDSYGKCHQPGAMVTRGCIQQACLKGGRLRTVKIQCLDQSTKACVDIGKVIISGGMKKKCTRHGSFKVIAKPNFCEDGKGGKIPVGRSSKNQDTCNTLKCVLEGYNTDWKIVTRGCRHEGVCHDVGDEWFDNTACENNKCVLESDAGNTVARVIALKGCKSKEGICYRVSQKWKNGCQEFECVRAGKTDSKINILSQGCQSDITGKCHNEGQTWAEKITGECYLFKCMNTGNQYIATKVRQVCHDHYGKCRDVGDTYYDCDVDGTTHYGCSCSIKDGHAYSSYKEDYKKPSDYDLYGAAYKAVESYGGSGVSQGGEAGVNFGSTGTISHEGSIPLPGPGKYDDLHPPPANTEYPDSPAGYGPSSTHGADYGNPPPTTDYGRQLQSGNYVPPLPAINHDKLSSLSDYAPPPKIDYSKQHPLSNYSPPPTTDYGKHPPPNDYAPLPTNDYGKQPPPNDYAPPPTADYGKQPPPNDYAPLPTNDYGKQPPPNDYAPPPTADYGKQPPINDYAPPPTTDYGKQSPPNDYAPPPTADYGKQPPPNDYTPPPTTDYGKQPPPNDYGPPPTTDYDKQPPPNDYAPPPTADYGKQPPPNDYALSPTADYGKQPLINDYAPPPTNDYGKQPSPNDYAPPPTTDYGKQPQINDYAPPPTADYVKQPPINDYVPPPTTDYGKQPSPNDYAPPPTADYGKQPPPNDYAPPPTTDYGKQPPINDYAPPPTTDYGKQPQPNDYVPPPTTDYGKQPQPNDYAPPPTADYVKHSPASDYAPPPTADYVKQPPASDYAPPPTADYVKQPPASDYAPPPTADYVKQPPASDYAPPPTAEYVKQPPASDYAPPPTADYVKQPPASDYAPPPTADYVKQPPASDYAPPPTADYVKQPPASDYAPPPTAEYVKQPPASDYAPPPTADYVKQPPASDYAPPPTADYVKQPPASDYAPPPTAEYVKQPSPSDYAPPVTSDNDKQPPSGDYASSAA